MPFMSHVPCSRGSPLSTDRHGGEQASAHHGTVTAHPTVQGKRPITDLVAALSDIDGVHSVRTAPRAV